MQKLKGICEKLEEKCAAIEGHKASHAELARRLELAQHHLTAQKLELSDLTNQLAASTQTVADLKAYEEKQTAINVKLISKLEERISVLVLKISSQQDNYRELKEKYDDCGRS